MDAPWMDIARQELGVEEVPGPKDNPRIEEYLATTTYPVPERYSDEVPWCSAFANWCLEKSGYNGTKSAWSQSWLSWGIPSGVVPGAIVVFYWGRGRGHVGFVQDADEDGLWVLGGNQGDRVSLKRFSYKKVRGYRWPV